MATHPFQIPEPKTSLGQTKNQLRRALKQGARCFQNENTVQKVVDVGNGTSGTGTHCILSLASLPVKGQVLMEITLYWISSRKDAVTRPWIKGLQPRESKY